MTSQLKIWLTRYLHKSTVTMMQPSVYICYYTCITCLTQNFVSFTLHVCYLDTALFPHDCIMLVKGLHVKRKLCLCMQTPNFHKLSAISLLAAIMSIGYSTIAIGVAGHAGKQPGTEYNLDGYTRMKGLFGIFNSLGTIAFAYGGHNVVMEIQATIPSRPTAAKPNPTCAPMMVRFCDSSEIVDLTSQTCTCFNPMSDHLPLPSDQSVNACDACLWLFSLWWTQVCLVVDTVTYMLSVQECNV